ncbi:MAG: tetratricopeptide repeat protein [Capnocytophaga sp.]|nr:tetratricopeptide repeat protein [Capnocytophaga sp.]
MTKYIFLPLFFLITIVSYAQNNENLFKQAEEFYNNGNYEEAIDNYHRILNTKKESAELYFNLANAYYKKGEIANSIYYYEKATALSPEDLDIKNNLQYAQQMVLDNIHPLPKVWTQRVIEKISRLNSANGWGVCAVLGMIAFVGSFLCYYFSRKVFRKRLFFTIMVFCVIFSVGSFFLGDSVKSYLHNQQYAILFEKEVKFYEEPNVNSKETFILHEGVKVKIIETSDNWLKIKVADGRIGWTTKNTLRKL